MREFDEQEFVAVCRKRFGGTRFPMTKDMNMVELMALIQESAQEIAQVMLKSRLAEDPRTDPPEPKCRQCQGKLRIQEHAQRRALNTAIGEIEYRRAYGVCDRCGHTAAPLDEALGIPSFGPSVEVMRKISHAATTARSFAMAADILKEHSGIEMSAKQVRVSSESEGARVAAARAQEVEVFRKGEKVVGPSTAPALIVVTADGGRIQTRQSDKDKERELKPRPEETVLDLGATSLPDPAYEEIAGDPGRGVRGAVGPAVGRVFAGREGAHRA